jgi:DNA-binding response OmpR family regulator
LVNQGQPTILVVEDDEALSRLFCTTLRVAGFDVLAATDGMEALRRIDAYQPDLILLDLALPSLGGRAVREEIASNVHTRSIPVVVVTGSGEDVAGLDAARVVMKPVLPSELVEVVRESLRKS